MTDQSPSDPPSTSDLPRRERERLARKQAMLDAARAAFAEKGVDGTVMDEIADRAEFGKGTLYNYFPGGKDEILLALFEQVFEGYRTLVASLLPGDPEAYSTPAAVRDAFCTYIEEVISYLTQNGDVFRLLMDVAQRLYLDPDPERVRFFVAHHERITTRVVQALEWSMASGAIRTLDARSVAHLINGNIRGYLMAARPEPCPDTDAAVDWPQELPFATAGDAADFISTILFDGLLVPGASGDGAPTPSL